MKKFFILTLLVAFFQSSAQDSVFDWDKWKADVDVERWKGVFSDYMKEAYAGAGEYEEYDAYNKKFKVGEYYHCLVIYRDSTQAPVQFKMPFTNMLSLCDPKENLEGKDLRKNQNWSIPKKEVKFFVFHDLPFAPQDILQGKRVLAYENYWSMVLIDGPIRYTKYFKVLKMSTGSSVVDDNTILKNGDLLGTDIQTMGGFGFKKFGAKNFSDFPDLANKISSGQDGYKQKDALKIITEYNQWALQADQNAFKKAMLFRNFITGPVQ